LARNARKNNIPYPATQAVIELEQHLLFFLIAKNQFDIKKEV